jgi:hypothetical protein
MMNIMCLSVKYDKLFVHYVTVLAPDTNSAFRLKETVFWFGIAVILIFSENHLNAVHL